MNNTIEYIVNEMIDDIAANGKKFYKLRLASSKATTGFKITGVNKITALIFEDTDWYDKITAQYEDAKKAIEIGEFTVEGQVFAIDAGGSYQFQDIKTKEWSKNPATMIKEFIFADAISSGTEQQMRNRFKDRLTKGLVRYIDDNDATLGQSGEGQNVGANIVGKVYKDRDGKVYDATQFAAQSAEIIAALQIKEVA